MLATTRGGHGCDVHCQGIVSTLSVIVSALQAIVSGLSMIVRGCQITSFLDFIPPANAKAVLS